MYGMNSLVGRYLLLLSIHFPIEINKNNFYHAELNFFFVYLLGIPRPTLFNIIVLKLFIECNVTTQRFAIVTNL